MYEKHIQDLKFRSDASACCPEALDAAIALMRAAAPLDPKAEREHCHAAILAIINNPIHATTDLVRERAAARAEGYAQRAALGDQNAVKLTEARAALTAASDEIAEVREALRVKDELWRSLGDANGELMCSLNKMVTARSQDLSNQLTAANARIAELEKRFTQDALNIVTHVARVQAAAELETKLTALREAAERFRDDCTEGEFDAFCSAIEASKK